MIARLTGYDGMPMLACFAHDENVRGKLACKGLNGISVRGGRAFIEPLGVSYPVEEWSLGRLLACDDYDVLEIEPDGRMRLRFGNSSRDNTIFITGRCNSACVMCPDSDSVRARAGMRDIRGLLQLVRYLPSDARHLTITGGEPFLLGEDMFKLLSALSRKCPRTEYLLLTNGRVFSLPDYLDRFIESSPRSMLVGIPLHGPDAQSHDAITRVSGSFQQTFDGLRGLLKQGVAVELRLVVSKISAPNLLRTAQIVAEELPGVRCVKFIGLEMLGNAALNADDVWLPYSEAFAASKPAIRLLIERGVDVGLYNFPLCSVEKGFWSLCQKSISEHKVRYADECENCYVRTSCGGIFAGTRRYAVADVKPVERPFS